MIRKILIPIFTMAIGFTSCGSGDDPMPTPTPEKKLRLTKVITTIKYKEQNGEKEKKRTLKIFYGTNGFVGKSTLEGNDDNQVLFTYNDKNQLIKSTETYEKKGKEVTETTTYTYNPKGLLITVLEDTDSKKPHKTIYEYNDKNLMVKRIHDADTKNQTVDTYEYDTNGQLKKRRYSSGEDETVIVYTFDTKKNPFSLLLPKEFRLTNPKIWGDHNYLIETDNEYYTNTSTYTYNDDGYPTKVIKEEHNDKDEVKYTEIIQYFYE